MSVLSLIIPAYNEEESIRLLYREIVTVLEKCGISFEVLFVDDGSTDATPQIIRELIEEDDRVRGYRLMQCSRKAGALMIGFEEAHGSTLITMDADLQDDPAELPKFLAEIERGADVVNGWKVHRLDSWTKKSFSWVMNSLASLLFRERFHDMNCGYKAYRSTVAKALTLPGGFYRFIPHILGSRGYDVREIPIRHRSRTFGRTKFGLLHRLRGPFDLLAVFLITKVHERPLRSFGWIGGPLLTLGLVICGYLSWIRLHGTFIGSRPLLLLGVLLIVVGMQLLLVGILCAFLIQRRSEVKRLPAYKPIAVSD